MDEKENCKELIYDKLRWRSFPCSRYAVKDGFCKQHHPGTVKKRQEEISKRWEAKRKRSPEYQLRLARVEIEDLKAEIKKLKGE